MYRVEVMEESKMLELDTYLLESPSFNIFVSREGLGIIHLFICTR
jgi:hypothetical protein